MNTLSSLKFVTEFISTIVHASSRPAVVAIAVFATVSSHTFAAPVTNADVEKLLAAGMDDAIVLNVIAAGEPKFDTSPDALIALKQKGASPAILAAITRGTPKSVGATPPTPSPAIPSAKASMEELEAAHDVIFDDGSKRETMIYSTPEFRVAGKITGAFTMGLLSRMYWVMDGSQAQLRTANHQPKILITVPRNSRPDQSIRLTLWATRANGTREIMAARVHFNGGDSEMIKQGPDFPSERVIPVSYTQVKDESGAPVAGRYELTPKAPLLAGEYAVVVHNQAFDFGVN